MRRIFVGDIQGCREELERLLEAVRYDPAADRLEPVGDFVNRGPDSLGVLRLLRTLGAGGVLGNHDLHLLRCAAGTREVQERDTFQDVLADSERDGLLAWLSARPFVRCWKDVWLVHAALHPAWRDPERELAGIDPLATDARSEFATRVRYCAADGSRPRQDWPAPRAPFVPWYEHWLARAQADAPTLVFGHWARQGLVLRPGLRALDSGCVWGRELTAWIAEEDRIVQVSAARTYSDPSAD
jgi:bis(5'-nucleosyl)-tetraphosphatase (symmetrical)